ncbi:UDP-N-acetylmuramoyl-tripeptide--D-alanyl-D-alanine ligase [Pseudoxanthomonas sp. LH2527]|uniref:UDP-N-acetylmuramoyl-tripeptide--D-alanyl-D- alanine ligase n=1 Tax=Pseudoxanthomonas sp. LH2527 TaxID=2923249 RepID=UPI001F13E68F|nr:UDP-N-acetylmuramoyl-tripeptide--D-alanyl-D-alanine ligase [Pseudoxanthomonas sp. LH2527]MCH6482957.1 UDP-N-acetylmuramoyl-tripeptide--D-alanyl-D-alanine ligase [Pseudoxanthomonas sp. LH2527]
MKRLPLSLLAHWAGGELLGDDLVIGSLTHDTRALVPGSLYVALRGERFDGHDFAYDAAMRGAAAVLVDHEVKVDVPQVVVPDTLLALARIAAGLQRDRVEKTVAITGSNGKTTVKTLVVSILQRAGVAYFNPGNRNNEIGLPMAVIEAPDDADFSVYEMGAGKPGDIAYLTDIVTPEVALVNNIAAAHLERLGSLMGVAETKGAIYEALPADGTAVINADDAFAEYFASRVPDRRILRFGLEATADLTARDIRATADGSDFVLVAPHGEIAVQLHLPGRHNVLNALAAAGIAMACGVSLAIIADGLSAAQPVAGRQVAHTLPNGAVVIDDSYNANPGSLIAAIDTLAAASAQAGGEGWLVLGDMRELGDDAEALHADAGRRAKAAGLRRLYTLGPLSAAAAAAFGEGALAFDDHASLADALRGGLRDGVRCLVKGSRGSAMDRIVAALLSTGEDTPHVA